MKLPLFTLSIVFCLACLPSTAAEIPNANPTDVGMSDQALAKVTKIVNKAVQDNKTAGAVVVVLRRGKVVHFSATGWQNIAAKQPMKDDTIFRIYSMTKPITNVAAMMLWEQGHYQLDDAVSKYLPELKDLKVYAGGVGDDAKYVTAEREMTVRDLMRHTSGLTYGGGKTPVDARYRQLRATDEPLGLTEFVRRLGQIPLKYQPGMRFEYGYSTDVLGRLVEVWSKQTLDKYLAEYIFKPLDMRDSGFIVPDAEIDRFAANYGPDTDGGLKVIDTPQTSRYRKAPAMLSGGGGLVSTARDYSRFCQMLLNRGTLDDKRLLKSETVDTMLRNHIPKSALPIVQGFPRVGWGFGLGFSIRYAKNEKEPLSPIGECRWGGAASTHFWLSPKDDLAVVVLQQHRPFIRILESGIKPIVYSAIMK